MRFFCRLAFLFVPVLCVGFASASPLDFKANVLDPPVSALVPTPVTTGIFGITFAACSPGELPFQLTADGCFAGVNETGSNWTGLKMVFPNDAVLNSQPVDCTPASAGNIFQNSSCSLNAGEYTLIFTQGILGKNERFFITETGVPYDEFPDGLGTVLTTTGVTPEPTPLLLLASGLGFGLISWKVQR